ncbi:MAG: hypothetical protein ACKOYN_04150 [Planctomycetota bacterium]
MTTGPAHDELDVRAVALRLEARAWELIDRGGRTATETEEMVDAAHGLRALRRMLGRSPGDPRMLRAHQTVACASARAGLDAEARAAVRQAERFGCEHPASLTPFDRAMTMACAVLARSPGGFPDYEPLLALAATLERRDRETLARLLPWRPSALHPAGPR